MNEDNLVEQANKAAARLEQANKVSEELVKRMEAIESRRVLGGLSEAGQAPPPVMTEEEKFKVEMKNFFKGSAIEAALK